MTDPEESIKKGVRLPGGGRKPLSTEGYAVRMNFTFPPDVAEFLRLQKNSSAFLTELVRREMKSEKDRLLPNQP